ncbi:MAG TPA: long-chain-fatty-acid--CoA ligase [Solirubrobacteraceae bacterium]
MTLADLRWPLERAARVHGESVAVTSAGRSLTYAELAQRVAGLGAALAGLGVEPGDRVAFLGVNSLAHLECWLGVPAAGRVLVDLNTRLAVEELAFMVDDCAPRVLVHDPANADLAAALRDRCGSLEMLVADGAGEGLTYERWLADAVDGGARGPQPAPIGADTLAAISYTGGTTGSPKGVMLSHGNLAANALHNLIITGHRADDVFLHVNPMFHVAGIANVVAATWVGARQVVLPRFDPAAVTETIERERVTLATFVPTMLAMWLVYLDAHPDADVFSLRNLHYAASPISPELQRRVCESLAGCEIAQMYGMTEAAPTVTHLSPEVHRRGVAGEQPYASRLGSMGAPVPGVRAEVRDPEGRPLAPGEIGEVWVSGPNVMLGYWNRPEATAAALTADGWYRTGDAAYADAGGYLFMVDRLKDMIISGGENVYSIEVENALASLDGVAEAAVFGVPDPQWGERVHAVVVLSDASAVDEDALRAHCRGRIAGFKVPRSFELRTEPLPRSGAGKVLKNPLREPHWRHSARRVS